MAGLRSKRDRARAELALLRDSRGRRERELERLLAGFIASAHSKPHCKCETAKALRALEHELQASERACRKGR